MTTDVTTDGPDSTESPTHSLSLKESELEVCSENAKGKCNVTPLNSESLVQTMYDTGFKTGESQLQSSGGTSSTFPKYQSKLISI